ncbi:hypothetical protein ODZ84_16440 [Chryseobacterium fluminis]|uniref:hypothetical protein n=1 Tax=Chryseobacterium fluminis TaxID=2983606 RepID=UPI002253556D|nr:hypothetical protein [Chryseobacterium sp. MMS21-Ot14]UZT96797.1 hypothetical protein ODZ84_16440 [Chryseobacterium sp. MMS21-Ot14]
MQTQTLLLTINASEEFIAFIPVILYFLILFLVFWKLRRDQVTLKELLLDKDVVMEVEKQQAKQAQETVRIVAKLDPITAGTYVNNFKKNEVSSEEEANPKQTQSISRLLAFISGLISVGLACTIITFYMWSYFNKNIPKPELNELLTVLLSLGVGVIPYAFNKVGNALKNS